jgi:hypothetical protein
VDALYPWLIADFPQVITPALPGLGPFIEDSQGRNMVPTDRFYSTRILFRLSPGSNLAQVQSRFQTLNPTLRFQIVRYAPGAERALENLRWQTQLFLGLAILSCTLSIWGLISGFLALLDAQRYRLALERVIGLNLVSLQRQWWIQTLAFCGVSGTLGGGLALLLSTPLYNAFGLEVPSGEPGNVLPIVTSIQTRGVFYILLVVALVFLTLTLVKIGVVYFKSQSVPRLLKEGA